MIKLLWTARTNSISTAVYNIKKGWLAPKPVQQPHPVVMNAGGSERAGVRREKCDVAFTVVQSHEIRTSARRSALRKRARALGREIQVWTNCYIVQGEPRSDAESFGGPLRRREGDWEAAEIWCTMLGINSQPFRRACAQQLKAHFIAGWGGLGRSSARGEQIVDKLARGWSDVGFDGVILSSAKFVG